jgi:CheY-like chemotaxis protein
MLYSNPVLIADDDEDTAFFLERSFKRAGLDAPVSVASDGEAAIKYFEDPACKMPLLVLLDIRMPLRDGFEVLRNIRKNPETQYLPVIIFSDSRAAEDINRAYDLGANSFVAKPTSPAELQATVDRIINYWLGLNENPPIG